MNTDALLPLLEQLDDQLDDLEEILEPLLGKSLVNNSQNLPLMDKAKLHVLVTYTLESLIFSYLRLHGANAQEHAVYRELTRVKQYFAKIKALEEPEKRTLTLDKEAASRFIKHGLAGNKKIDFERAEREAKERAQAEIKAAIIAKKMALEQKESSTSDSSSDSSSDEVEEVRADEKMDTNLEILPKNSEKRKKASESQAKALSDASKGQRKNKNKKRRTNKSK
ncbi:hypothetical protein N7495_009503 [Penicillium taxi]|uniref:uncharacterized protein n=1 Tax=Penicillium taxi TaxID=168475 RepID=UPI002544D6B0|nr:uncharacterized protein N7495_009503 [Penicillium taxi]KAJ5884993.1 hypothetical protein N7495_009503 [Penicillium taxi]